MPVVDEDIDGKITVTELHGNIYLTITQPGGQGKPVTMNKVEQELADRNLYDVVDYEKIKQALDSNGEFVKIGQLSSKMPPKEERAKKKITGIIKGVATRKAGDKIEVTLSDDHMKAYIRVDSLAEGEEIKKLSRIIERLKKKKVVYGINRRKIIELIRKELYSKQILVAEGRPVVEGRYAELIYEFSPDINVTSEVVQDGNIEYYRLNKAQYVEKDQVLVRKKQGISGMAGIDVQGRRIQCNKKGTDTSLPQGKNTVISENGTELLAAVDGYLFISEGTVSVERERMIIKGDVAKEETGDVSFTGDVTIIGDVLPETRISATGDVEILGVAHKAEIESQQGNVIIHERGYEVNIDADGDVKIKMAEHCHINARKGVLVTEYLLDCVVMAEGKVIVDGEEGIVGGEVYAGLEIQSSNIGSPDFTPTKVGVTNSIPLAKEIYSVTQKLSVLGERLNIDNDNDMEEDQILLLENTVKEYISQKEKLESLKKEQEETEKANLNSMKDKGISVKEKIYEGVEVRIENTHKLIEQTLRIRNFENIITLTNARGRIVRRQPPVIVGAKAGKPS